MKNVTKTETNAKKHDNAIVVDTGSIVECSDSNDYWAGYIAMETRMCGM